MRAQPRGTRTLLWVGSQAAPDLSGLTQMTRYARRPRRAGAPARREAACYPAAVTVATMSFTHQLVPAQDQPVENLLRGCLRDRRSVVVGLRVPRALQIPPPQSLDGGLLPANPVA